MSVDLWASADLWATTGEHFIPWEQIEPLLTPGMTWGEFNRALMTHLGLSPDQYKVHAMNVGVNPVRLGGGVWVRTLAQRDALIAAGLAHAASASAPVAQ
jgi:hypothetical protein